MCEKLKGLCCSAEALRLTAPNDKHNVTAEESVHERLEHSLDTSPGSGI